RVGKTYEVLIIQAEAHVEAWQSVDVGRFVGVGGAAAVGEGDDVGRQIAAWIGDNVRRQWGTARAVGERVRQIRGGRIGDAADTGFTGSDDARADVADHVDVSENIRVLAPKVEHDVAGTGLFIDMLDFG